MMGVNIYMLSLNMCKTQFQIPAQLRNLLHSLGQITLYQFNLNHDIVLVLTRIAMSFLEERIGCKYKKCRFSQLFELRMSTLQV